MDKRKIFNRSACVHAVTVILFLLSCLFMYDFYKCLSGFIANGFREPTVMLPMIANYLLPVLCFLFYFYDFYVKSTGRTARAIYTALAAILAILNLVGIVSGFDRYASNNALGSYQTIPSIIVSFPYDGLIVNAVILLAQLANVFLLLNPTHPLAECKNSLKQCGKVRLNIVEYLLLCLLAILTFVFVGAAFWSMNAIENALYDWTFIFLVLWVLILPLCNLLLLVFKPEKRNIRKQKKIGLLSVGLIINVGFTAALLIIEKLSPSFIVHVGKPLFAIAFSVSLPIEMLCLPIIAAISTIVLTIRLILVLTEKKATN